MAYGTLKCDNITFTNGGVDQTVTVSGIVQSISGNITATGTIQGATIIGTSTVSGATVTGDAGVFTTVTGGSAGFTTVTGTTVTGTTADFASGVFTTQISGATVTGDIGSFTTLTGGVATITSGVFALGAANLPSISFSGDPNTGIYSPGADQLALSTNGEEKARIDSSGRLLVGTSSTSGNNASLQVRNDNSGAVHIQAFRSSDSALAAPNISVARSRGTAASPTEVTTNDLLGAYSFVGYDGASWVAGATIEAYADGTWTDGGDTTDNPGRLVFSVTADGASSPTERMRITNDGKILIGNDNLSGALTVKAPGGTFNSPILYGWATNTSYTSNVVNAQCSTSAGAGYNFYTGYAISTLVYQVQGNGDVKNTNNSYGAISDIKLKENIVDANSQWSDIKALQVRNYNFKEGQTHTQIGLIAQEVELVSPGLVSESPDRDEDGNDLGTVTKSVNYSVLYMKAVKALQEAMERIETLEAEVAALKAS